MNTIPPNLSHDAPEAFSTPEQSPDWNGFGFLKDAPQAGRYADIPSYPGELGDILRSWLPKHGRVLDVGCGTGALRRLFPSPECRMTGVEPDQERAAITAADGGYDLVLNRFFDDSLLPLLGQFDTIVFADVLEHMPNPGPVLASAARFLKPGGEILISVPNVAHWSVRLGLLFGRFEFQDTGIMDATHLRWFTKRSVKAFVERCGYLACEHRLSLGAGLPAYSHNRVLRRIKLSLRLRMLRALVPVMPGLFGCQHVMRLKSR